MTDEEMAKDYVQTECCNSCTDSCKKNKCKMYCNVRNAVLYGLKAGKDMAEADLATIAYMQGAERYKTKWHKVADGDLPKPNIAVLIYFQFEKWTTTYIAYYRPAIKKWQMYNLSEAQRQPIDDDYIDSEEVIAWCEIPTFTDKETK